MKNVNDFVYSFSNGIGKILEVKNDTYSIQYLNTKEESSFTLVQEISDDVPYNLMNKSFLDFFDYTTKKRGMAYFHEGRVKDAYAMGKTISGVVSGSEDYSVSITVSKNTIRSRCTCPVGSSCKHSVAVLSYVADIFSKLTNPNMLKTKMESDIPKIQELTFKEESIIDRLDSINSSIDLDAAYEFIDLVVSKDSSFIDSVIRHLNQKYRNKLYYFLTLKRILTLNDDFYLKFKKSSYVQQGSAYGKEIETTRARSEAFIRRISNGGNILGYEYETAICYYISNHKENELIRFIFEKGNQRDLKYYIPYLIKRMDDLGEAEESYKRFCIRYDEVKEITDAFLDKLSLEEQASFYKNNPSLQIQIEYLKSLKPMDQMEIIERQCSKGEMADYILDQFPRFLSLDMKKSIGILYRTAFFCPSKKTQALSILKKLPNTELVIKLLQHSSKEYDYTDDALFEYFDFDYTIDDHELSYIVSYCIRIGGLDITVGFYDGMKYFSDDENLTLFEKSVIGRIEEKNEFIEEIDAIQKKINERLIFKKRQSYVNAIRDFSESLSTQEIVKNTSNKIHLELSLYPTSFYNSDGYAVSLRCGTDKLYVIKDIVEFLDAVAEGITLKYGKVLEFNHSIENFSESARKILSYFLSIPYKSFMKDSKKGIVLNSYTVSSLLEALRGEYIIFHEQSVFIRLNPITPSISIDENYVLHTDLIQYELLNIQGLYAFNSKENVMDKVLASPKDLKLYRFIYDHDGMDVSLVKEDFMDSIYSRFSSKISLAKEIEKDFLANELLIHVYFDYENSIILEKTEYYRKDIKLEYLEMNSSEQAKCRLYHQMLDAMGFLDHKLVDENAIYSFLTMDFSYLRELAVVYLSDALSNKTISPLSKPNVRIQYNNSMMEMFMEESEYSEEELYMILSAIRKKKKYIELTNDRIVDLDTKDAAEMISLVEDLDMNERNLLSPQLKPIYQSFKCYAHMNNTSVDEYITKMLDELIHFKESSYELPSVDATLREYQKDAYRWMRIISKYHLGGVLADDMGLGKTLEMITLLKSDKERLPSLIVVPKSLLFNWYSEFEKFDREARIVKIYGSGKERKDIIQRIPRDEKVIYITGYDSLRNDISLYEGKIFNYLILDEAQAIKNVHTEKSKTVKTIEANHRFALTGTPIENGVLDLWSIFDFIMPGFFPSLSLFKSKYESSSDYVEGIRLKIAPFILRRTKTEVLKDLPGKFERILSADMSIEQRKLYDGYILEAKKQMELGAGSFDLLPYLTRLRQICVSPSLFLENMEMNSGKIDVLMEILDEYIPKGRRILIFSSFVSALELIEKKLMEGNILYLKLTGKDKPEDRLEYVKQFNQDPQIGVFLISLKAGGTGLNLTGADTVIHLDPWWNVSAENQATDRAHRIGQTKNVEVIKLVCEDSIEQKVIELQNLKKDIIDKLIAKDDTAITGFSLDDLKYILE